VYQVTYKLSVAGWSVDSSADSRTELLDLDVLHEMNSPAGHCEITVFATGGTPVRGVAVKSTDPMSVELEAGSVSGTVATAGLQSIDASLEVVRLVGRTGMQKLAETRVNQVYENRSLGDIVTDLAGQAGATTGDIEQGGDYQYLAVHESRSVLRTILDLAAREGMDVYCDTDDKLVVKKFAKVRSDHVFRYGIEILDLSVRVSDPVADHALVHGESPSSSSGADTWHWLVSDLGPYRGENGSGSRLRTRQDGAIRTKAAADAAAGARLATIAESARIVRLVVLGRPTLRLGDAVELQDVPGELPDGVLKVRSVRHVVNRTEGYVTIAELGATGAGGLGGAASAAAGALAGVLG
jgi:hypothetical protein